MLKIPVEATTPFNFMSTDFVYFRGVAAARTGATMSDQYFGQKNKNKINKINNIT